MGEDQQGKTQSKSASPKAAKGPSSGNAQDVQRRGTVKIPGSAAFPFRLALSLGERSHSRRRAILSTHIEPPRKTNGPDECCYSKRPDARRH